MIESIFGAASATATIGSHVRHLLTSLAALPPSAIGLALLLTAASYVALTVYEALALRYVGRTLPYRTVAFASSVIYGLGQSLGFPLLAGGAVRARIYATLGIPLADAARITAFGATTMWLGIATVTGAVFSLQSGEVARSLGISETLIRYAGVAGLLSVAIYLGCSMRVRGELKLWKQTVAFPVPRVAFAQVAASVVDWLVSAGVLYVLLPHTSRLPFVAFIAVFSAAQVAGLLSHLPGGVGVFDTIILAALTSHAGAQAVEIVAALAAYRAIYYGVPLAVASVLLGRFELASPAPAFGRVKRFVDAHAHNILAGATFILGAMLLFSGATPPISARLTLLQEVSLGPATESAYFLSSLVGLALLLIARGLQRRLDAAYMLTIPLLTLGIAFSLLKGLDYEEASALAVMLVVLIPARAHFSRRASLTAEAFTPGWLLGIGLVLSSAVWIAIFSSTHVLFSSDGWAHFSFTGGAPARLWTTVGAACIGAVFGGMRLLRVAMPRIRPPDEFTQRRLRDALAVAPRSAASLALVGDKGILLSDDRKSFLMYGISGRSWIAMGDPVGPSEACAELARRFQSMAKDHGGRAAFYLVAPENLALYVDMGLAIHKIGETALVPLDSFSLDGGSRKSLRRSRKNAVEAGCSFQVIPPDGVDKLLPALRAVSRNWLAAKRGKEKRFSLGYFDERYLRQCPIAVVFRNGACVAFANLWVGSENGELSVDLMRYSTHAPLGMVDYLLSEILLWGKRNGYRTFDLGMTPLAGLGDGRSGTVWQRTGALVFRHGRRFYNFEGLRQYKEKFDPIWQGRYIASPGGLKLALVLSDVAQLISGGVGFSNDRARVAS